MAQLIPLTCFKSGSIQMSRAEDREGYEKVTNCDRQEIVKVTGEEPDTQFFPNAGQKL